MCGIAGKLGPAAGAELRACVDGICAAQEHRGPDSRGIHAEDGVALGIQRLAVIDLDTGDQPIYNEDRTVVVVLNGEIYNFRELREELRARGHTFATAGDTEVIVHAYEEFGDACVERLAGMFCFALWDRTRKRLLIGRDRLGKKPLHYFAPGDGTLTFASEIGALVSDRSVPRDLDLASVDTYLAYGYIQAPHSIYADVRKLPPAHTLVWESGQIRIERYWKPDYLPKLEGHRADLGGELRGLIAAAVRRRMIADVPLGAFLSGGIDSSVVVSEMAFHSPEPIKTFSIGFGDEAYNELPRARLIAERFGTDHTELEVTPDAIELLPKLVRHYGEPYADSSAIPSMYLAELTRKHVTVALNGDGGDESFAGYMRTAADARTAWLDRVPGGARAAVAAGADRALTASDRRSAVDYVRRFASTLPLEAQARYAEHVGIFSAAERASLLAGDAAAGADPVRTAAVIGGPHEEAAAAGYGQLDRLLWTDLCSYLPGDLLTKVDIATMAHSLEARSPLLDHEVVEFAARLPERMKLRGRQKKWLLRDAYRHILPAEILDGPKKGFGVPLAGWLRDELAGEVRDVLLDPAAGGGLFDRAEIGRIVERHQSGAADNSARIWALLFFERWRAEAG